MKDSKLKINFSLLTSYFLLALLLCGVCFGDTIKYDLWDLAHKANALIVYPGDDISAKYDWLKSSDRDSRMGSLSYTSRRVLQFSPGTYNLGSSGLVADTSFVDFYAPFGGVILTADVGVTVIERTALNVHMKGFTIKVIPSESAGRPYPCGLKENAVNLADHVTLVQDGDDCTLNATDIGVDVIPKSTAGSLSKYPYGDEILIYDTNGTKRYWYDIIAVADDDNITIEDCTATDFNDPNVAVVSMTSRFEDMEFLLIGSAGGAGVNGSGRPVWGAAHLGGTWLNCGASSMAWRTETGMDCHPVMHNCWAGHQSIGGDNEGSFSAAGQVSGKFYNTDVTDMGFGGCSGYGMGCSSQSYFWNCHTYSMGFSLGYDFAGQAYYSGGDGPRLFGASTSNVTKGGFSGFAKGCYAGETSIISYNSFGMAVFIIAGYGNFSGHIEDCRIGPLANYVNGTLTSLSATKLNNFTGTILRCHPYKPTACTGNTTVYTFLNGHTYTNEGAASTVTWTLPKAKKSLYYKFIRTDYDAGEDVRVNPNGSEHIFQLDGTDCGAGNWYGSDPNTDDYWELKLKCVEDGEWRAVHEIGTFAVEP